jgi:AraC family transcriptional regulator
MVNYRIIQRPAFDVTGAKTWISGQDNSLFGRFWQQCHADGLIERLQRINGSHAGTQTGGTLLGVSCVQKDPAVRAFDYLIAVEAPEGGATSGLETMRVPAGQWVVFECRGAPPESIMRAEMFAFMEWLPASGYEHANAPEMEVYPPGENGQYCEFWLPVRPASGSTPACPVP